MRRVSTTSSVSSDVKSPPPPPPPRPAQEEPEPEGEWAEAVYEYSSEVRSISKSIVVVSSYDIMIQDPGDLPLQEGQRVLIVERTSDDWLVNSLTLVTELLLTFCRWTGEYQGRRGLVPASYMKVF